MPSYTDFDENAGEMGQKASDFRETLSLCIPSYTVSDRNARVMGQKASDSRARMTFSLGSNPNDTKKRKEKKEKRETKAIATNFRGRRAEVLG